MSDRESQQASIDASEASIPAENGTRDIIECLLAVWLKLLSHVTSVRVPLRRSTGAGPLCFRLFTCRLLVVSLRLGPCPNSLASGSGWNLSRFMKGA